MFVQVSPAPVVAVPTYFKAPPPKTMRPALAEVALSTPTVRICMTPSLMLALPLNVESAPTSERKLMKPLPDLVRAWLSLVPRTKPATDQSPPP